MVGYGLFVLVIREAAVRMNAGTTRIVLMGLAYGIVNEGLFAKTLVTRNNLPINQFDGYAVVLGFNTGWASAILLWHAFASVLFPIYLVHYCLPDASRERWLTNKQMVVITVAISLFAVANFLLRRIDGATNSPIQLSITLGAIFALVLAAVLLEGSPLPLAHNNGRPAIAVGMSAVIPMAALIIMATERIPPAIYFLVLLLMVAGYNRLMWRLGWVHQPALVYFGVGWYIQNAVGSIIASLHNPSLAALMLVVDTMLISATYCSVAKASKRQQHDAYEQVAT